MSMQEKIRKGFIRERVLIPDVLMTITSLLRIIIIKSMSIDMRNERGKIRLT